MLIQIKGTLTVILLFMVTIQMLYYSDIEPKTQSLGGSEMSSSSVLLFIGLLDLVVVGFSLYLLVTR